MTMSYFMHNVHVENFNRIINSSIWFAPSQTFPAKLSIKIKLVG